jgi:hypothetical protein
VLGGLIGFGVGVEDPAAAAGLLMSGDLKGFLSVVLATSTRRRLAPCFGVFDDMAVTCFEMHLTGFGL